MTGTITEPYRRLWAELTNKCQLECVMCYADSGPNGGHGAMGADDWMNLIDQAAAAKINMVQFIGGCFRTRRVPWGTCLIRLSSADARNLLSGPCRGAVRGRWLAGAGVAAPSRRAGLRAGRLPVS